MMIANGKNMRENYRPGVIAYSYITDEQYSANPGDYWWFTDDECLEDCEGNPMHLVVEHRYFEELMPMTIER